MKLAKVLNAYRADMRCEAQDVASEIGISNAVYSRIVTGKKDSVSVPTLLKIIVWLLS